MSWTTSTTLRSTAYAGTRGTSSTSRDAGTDGYDDDDDDDDDACFSIALFGMWLM